MAIQSTNTNMKHYFDTFLTPLGRFSIALDERGTVVASAFGGKASLRSRFQSHELIRDPQLAATSRQQVLEFFSGTRQKFTVKLAPSGTLFQKRVWSALQRIPFGETRSYGQLAAQVGNRRAARAVGKANADNPICLLVPCHRVIGTDGSLTGFAFGQSLKRRLLEHEGAKSETKNGKSVAGLELKGPLDSRN